MHDHDGEPTYNPGFAPEWSKTGFTGHSQLMSGQEVGPPIQYERPESVV
jgi:hypothetical protein